MLFDDSLEFEHVSPTKGAELICMKRWHDIRLWDVWIPSELLPNRLTPVSFNVRNKGIFHTLEKPSPVVDSLSVYAECDRNVIESNYSSAEKLLDSLEVSSCEDLNQCNGTNVENEHRQIPFEKECYISQEIYESETSSTADLLEHLYISDSDTEDMIPNHHAEMPDKSSVTVSVVTGTSDLNLSPLSSKLQTLPPVSFAESIVDSPSETVIGTADKSKTCLNSSACPTLSPGKVAGSEFQRCANVLHPQLTLSSDESHNNTAEPCEDFVFQYDLSADKVVSSKLIFDPTLENTHDSESFYHEPVNSLDGYLPLLCEDLPVTGNPKNLRDLNSVFENEPQHANKPKPSKEPEPVNEIKPANEEVTTTSEAVETAENEAIVNFPIAYKRPKEDDLVSDLRSNDRQKSKREKKSKKKSPKHIPLENFFLSKSESENIEPEIDEFYESIMRNKKETLLTRFSYIDPDQPQLPAAVFPSLPVKSEIKFMPWNEEEELKLEALACTNTVNDMSSSATCNKIVKEDVDTCSKERIIIENIPLGVDEEMLRSVVQSYGEISHLVLRRRGATLKAELVMILEDPEWIVESLNGSQPFGASKKDIKCYKR